MSSGGPAKSNGQERERESKESLLSAWFDDEEEEEEEEIVFEKIFFFLDHVEIWTVLGFLIDCCFLGEESVGRGLNFPFLYFWFFEKRQLFLVHKPS